jgi:DNA polymerase-3 subunit gamma/tau
MYYTKYRPQKFSDIGRTNDIADVIANQVKSGKTAHAYLMVGPRGTGKTTLARVLAKSLNCTNLKKNGDPCDECSNCVSIRNGSFIDLIEIDAASNRGIDDIRDLKDKIRLAPTMGSNKVYIIDEVHMLTTEAFNALLKTLEEPPKKTTFILCTTEEHKVPATIKSRCQIFKLKRPTVKQIVSVLKDISKEESIDITDEDLSKIAEASMGDYRGACVLLEQVHDGDINVNALLNLSSKKKYVECVGYLLVSDAVSALETISEVYEEGIDLYVWVGELLKYLRSMLFIKSGVKDSGIDTTEELLDEIKEQSKTVEIKWLVKTISIFMEAHKNIRSSFIPQLPVELAVTEICSSSNGSDNSDELPLPKGKGPDTEKSKKSADTSVKKSKKEDVGTDKKIKEEKVEEAVEIKEEIVEDSEEEPVIPFEDVKKDWDKFVKDSKDLNHSLTTILTLCTPVAVKGSDIIVEVFYPFHKERLESAKTKKLIEGLCEKTFGMKLGLKCIVNKNNRPASLKDEDGDNLTDLNVVLPSKADGKSILDVFDGGLPIVG